MLKIQGFWNVTSRLLFNCLLGLLVSEEHGTTISKLQQMFSKIHGAIHSTIRIFKNAAVNIIVELCESQLCYHFHYVLQCMYFFVNM